MALSTRHSICLTLFTVVLSGSAIFGYLELKTLTFEEVLGPINKDCAIEISRRTTAVQDALIYVFVRGYYKNEFEPYVDYWNWSYIESLIQTFPPTKPEWYNKMSKEHDIWRVFWRIIIPPRIVSIDIIHFVDEMTAEIIHEEIYYNLR